MIESQMKEQIKILNRLIAEDPNAFNEVEATWNTDATDIIWKEME